MNTAPTEDQIKQFFNMARYGDKGVIKMLELMPEYRDIEDSRGLNVFKHLVTNNQYELMEEILTRGLSSYSAFRKVGISMSPSSIKDRNYRAFSLLKKEDKQLMAEKGWYYLVEYNNVKTLSKIDMELLIKSITGSERSYVWACMVSNSKTFTKCSNEMLEIEMPIYTMLSNENNFLEGVFEACNKNEDRSITLIENIKGDLTPEIETIILKVNQIAITHLNRKRLKEKLSDNLEPRADSLIVKGKKI